MIATVIIITPLMGILGLSMIELVNQLIRIAKNQQLLVNPVITLINELDIPELIYQLIQYLVFNLSSIVLSMLGQISFTIDTKTALFVLNVIISVFVCFILLMNGSRYVTAIINTVPEDRLLIAESFIEYLDHILAGIFLSNICAAMITSILSVGVFYYFKVPHILSMSALILIAGLILIFAGWGRVQPIAISRYLKFGIGYAAVFIFAPAHGRQSGG